MCPARLRLLRLRLGSEVRGTRASPHVHLHRRARSSTRMMPPLVSLTLVCAMLRVSACVALCPARCECSETQRAVRCASAALHRIPDALPSDASSLTLTGDAISRVEQSAFSGAARVSSLDLSDNGIMEVGSHAFSSLPMLRSLILNNNRLVLIHPEAFSIAGRPLLELSLRASLFNHTSLTDLITALRWGQLSNLQRLDLSENRLILLPPGMFTPLLSLTHLLLHNNSLFAIYNGTFSGLEQLTELDLTGNAFKTINDEGLHELDRFDRVRLLLSQNPFMCTCEILAFSSWVNRSKVKVGDADWLRCQLPLTLRDVHLQSLTTQVLACDGKHQEIIPELSLQTSYVFLGLVLGFVGMVFLFVVYLNRKGIKKWITDIHEACRDVLEGYHYRYEIDSDPRLGRMSDGQQRRPRADPRQTRTSDRTAHIPSDVTL